MSVQIPFVKAQSLGNDFVITLLSQWPNLAHPHASSFFNIPYHSLAIKMGNRRLGIGCDQIIIVNDLSDQISVRFFNLDGSEAEACGNGSRAFAMWWMNKNKVENFSFSTQKSIVSCKKSDSFIETQLSCLGVNDSIDLGVYQRLSSPSPIFVDMGNPHLILFVEDTLCVKTLGPLFEKHELFPNHVNVSFVKKIDDHTLELRVYERGTGLTPACGSAAGACVVAASLRQLVSPLTSIKVIQEGGALEVIYDGDKSISQKGKAEIVFEGTILIEDHIIHTLNQNFGDNPQFSVINPKDIYVGSIISYEKSGNKITITADFGEHNLRKTEFDFIESLDFDTLMGMKILGVFPHSLVDSTFTLMASIDDYKNINIINAPHHYKNGQKIIT